LLIIATPADLKPFRLDDLLKEQAESRTTRVTMRLPTRVVKRYKDKAAELDVPYQSLMKQQLAKGA
jgi:predicted DNA binding CopG/RHH family protein